MGDFRQILRIIQFIYNVLEKNTVLYDGRLFRNILYIYEVGEFGGRTF